MRRFLCLLLALVQVLPSLGAAVPRHSDSRPQYGTVGMADGVVTSENHQYLVDTSQPYAEVIQERAWATDGAGISLDGIAQVYRYDIGLDRLHYFKYQMPINGPPSLGSPVLSEWLLFDGLGSTRALVGDSGSVVDEFGYNDAFGIPYRVTANGSDRAVAPAGFFLNGQHVVLKGSNNHQDHAGVGTALPDRLQDFLSPKRQGCIRKLCAGIRALKIVPFRNHLFYENQLRY